MNTYSYNGRPTLQAISANVCHVIYCFGLWLCPQLMQEVTLYVCSPLTHTRYISQVERQKGLTTSRLHTQLAPYVSKLAIFTTAIESRFVCIV